MARLSRQLIASNMLINKQKLLHTKIKNMAPQRGFICSHQPYAAVIDVDLVCQDTYKVQIIKDGDKIHIFVRNGPIKINSYQPFFKIYGDQETLEYFQKVKFYIASGKYRTENDINAFATQDFQYEEVKFNKEIQNDCVIFHITKEAAQQLLNVQVIVAGFENNIDTSYSLHIYLFHNASENMFYQQGYDAVLSYIKTQLYQLKLTGYIYRTKNGLRVILTDKVRDISDLSQNENILALMETLFMDNGLLNTYKRSTPDSTPFLTEYLARLTPKLKNYSVFNNEYEKLLDLLDTFKLSELTLLNGIVPVQYDFKKVTYAEPTQKCEQVEEGFQILTRLIADYFKSNQYAVCQLIEKIDSGQEVEEFKEFIMYHDKWTKAKLSNTILI